MTRAEIPMPERNGGFLLSLVTPAFNEEQNLPVLYDRIRTMARQLDIAWEWIVVDDHSADGTFKVLQEIARDNPNVFALRFARNTGSHAAIMAGLEHARGDCAIVLASDLQDPPETMSQLLEKWQQGALVVWAVRQKREGEKTSKLAFARVYYWLMRNFVGIRNMADSGADFFLIDRRGIDAVTSYKENNVSVLALICWIGLPQESITYVKQPRLHGKSGWNLEKKLKLVVDSITSFTYRPVRAMSYLGIATAVLGFVYAAVVVANTLWTQTAPTGWASLMVVVLIVGGIQMVMMGVLGEYLWRALDESRDRPRYIVERTSRDLPPKVIALPKTDLRETA
jgi:polyisoprenyl-phosphate glycosyltransferase